MNTKEIPVGIVGLGLMGSSIAACMLIAGHPVRGITPIAADLEAASSRITGHLQKAFENGLVSGQPDEYIKQLSISSDYAALQPCQLVIECTLEDLDIKRSVYQQIESFISDTAILTSNTSAIPISVLQTMTRHPNRFLGLHWAEPAHTTRFLEIICGDASDVNLGEYLYQLAHFWNKEPILVRKDIAGFITNRLMYAMYREAINLVENGYATVEDVDRSCRNNAGYFMTFVGIFRWMDLTGVPAYHAVMQRLLPTLFNGTEVPYLIDHIVQTGGLGVANGKGFYEYEPGEAAIWKETFSQFSYEIRKLALKYPNDIVKKKLEELKNTAS